MWSVKSFKCNVSISCGVKVSLSVCPGVFWLSFIPWTCIKVGEVLITLNGLWWDPPDWESHDLGWDVDLMSQALKADLAKALQWERDGRGKAKALQWEREFGWRRQSWILCSNMSAQQMCHKILSSPEHLRSLMWYVNCMQYWHLQLWNGANESLWRLQQCQNS